MGRRGPRAIPIEQHRLTGSSAQYKHHGEVPIVDGLDPVKPEWLGTDGSALWDRMIDRLRNQGILSPAWQESLTTLCERWDRYQALVAACRDLALGDPLRKQCREASEDFMKLARDFGLTPASKTGIRTEPKPAGKDKSRFVKGTG